MYGENVKEEFDQYHYRLKMVKDEVFSEIKQEIDMRNKVAEIQIKKEIDSENVAPSELDFGGKQSFRIFYFFSKECS